MSLWPVQHGSESRIIEVWIRVSHHMMQWCSNVYIPCLSPWFMIHRYSSAHTRPVTAGPAHDSLHLETEREFYVLIQIQQEPKCLDTLNAANCTGASPIEIICFGPGRLAGGGELKFCHLFEYEHWAPPGALFWYNAVCLSQGPDELEIKFSCFRIEKFVRNYNWRDS